MAISHVVADGIATITLDRPEKLNALDVGHLLRASAPAGRNSQPEPDVNVIVVTGSGRAGVLRRRRSRRGAGGPDRRRRGLRL